MATGLELLDRELPEQVLDDGGNFELSPMYHSIMLMDVLDLINIANVFEHSELKQRLEVWKNKARDMAGWLKAMCHPDGEISMFNDAAMGIAPAPAKLFRYYDSLSEGDSWSVVRGPWSEKAIADYGQRKSDNGKRTTILKESGYVRLENNKAVALLDVAKVGPDYIPGHAHADSLSFELSVFGQRLLVNSGTSCYGLSDERLRQRGTAAHNTVVINNENSSEVWSGFRVARRAYPADLVVNEDQQSVSCSHTGYRWLKGKPEHTRQWSLTEQQLNVKDSVKGAFSTAQARYHLHPDVKARFNETPTPKESIEFTLPEGQVVKMHIKNGTAKLEPGSWHPEFGLSLPTQCVVVDFSVDDCEINLLF